MDLPLLEALLANNPTRVEDRLSRVDDKIASMRAFLVYSAGFCAPADDPNPMMVCVAYARKFLNEDASAQHAVSAGLELAGWLGSLQKLPVDSSVLQPRGINNGIFAVADLDEAFRQGRPDIVYAAVSDSLSAMDNKDYFLELLMRIALSRSKSAVLAVSAFGNALDILGWKNHFSPVLTLHAVYSIMDQAPLDKGYGSTTANRITGTPKISCLTDLELLGACMNLARRRRLLSSDIDRGLQYWTSCYLAQERHESWPENWSDLELIRADDALRNIGEVYVEAPWRRKIPF